MAAVAHVSRAALLAFLALRLAFSPAEGARVVPEELTGDDVAGGEASEGSATSPGDLGSHATAEPAELSFQLEGVPVYGALPLPKMRRAPGEPEPTREWIVVLKPDSKDDEVDSIINGSTACNDGAGCLKGNPSEGGVPFAEVSLSDGDLGAVLRRHAGRVDFVEADLPVSVIPEVPSEEKGFNLSLPGLDGDALLQGGQNAQWWAPEQYPWGIQKVGAQSDRRGGHGVHVYVIDTGIRTTHQDFGGRAFPTLETHQNKVIPCSPSDRNCAYDRQGHGTHCAGTVGGNFAGVAPQASLHAVKAMGDQGEGAVSNTIAAIDWIMTNGQRPAVLSMSLGGQGRAVSYQHVIDTAVRGGLAVVVAAGNDNDDACSYSPAYVPSAITVGATMQNNQRSGFSNYGACVNIFAPGSDIQSASHQGDDLFIVQSGTSMAAPHVAGAAARMLQTHPEWDQYKFFAELGKTCYGNSVYDVRGPNNILLHL